MNTLKRSLYIALTLILVFSDFSFGEETTNAITSVKWTSNILRIDTSKNISFTQSRVESPARLIVDINNCTVPAEYASKKFTSRLGETITIYQLDKDKVRIIFIGEASINRNVYLTNENKTLIAKIARIGEENKDEQDTDEAGVEKQLPEIFNYEVGELKGLTIEGNDKESELIIFASKKIKYATYTLKNPSRFAIDLLNIVPPDFPLPRYSPTKLITGVRIGRAASGIDATRVVIDITEDNYDSKVNANITGNQLKIKFIPSNKPSSDKAPAFKIIIDPGHGGYDHGAEYGGFNEKDINLAVSKKLKAELEKSGIKVFLTRENDHFVSLAERVEITNSVRPKLFISIHNNALTSSGVRGVETYYYTPQSQKLAYLIHKNILKEVNIPDHHIRKAEFYVCKYTPIPAILAELGFLSNPLDRKLLTTPEVQDKYVKAISNAIYTYLGVSPSAVKDDDKKELINAMPAMVTTPATSVPN